ncbi:ATP-binding protein [Clostridium estertheticum]|uniref:ATP-binding protein n=1 Tax=Clostridium estertheticum TaxID=238834 RepID=UPI001CF28C48|nr:ATP-binding protein [Clostridium estertheticum]MCB2356420.1 ATP-binding protein [Clostridium estertheticum]WAG39635.1 ATP-binding protein [Clostridium estertheticum]
MSNKQTEIGEVISVSGNIITVQLSENLKSNMPIIDGVVYRVGQIGSFLKIPLGYEILYGIVTQIGVAAIPENLKVEYKDEYNRQWLNLALVGERIGEKFERGVSQSPTTGDKVHLVTIRDLDVIYEGIDNSNSITVGNISISQSLNAKIDIDKLISRHCAILGSTGSGKSNAVGVILNSIASKGFNCARILVIDPHGEYNSVFKDKSSVYKVKGNTKSGEKELFIPFWALPFDELMSIFPGSLSDQNKEYFRTKIVEAKLKSVNNNTIQILNELVTADTPIPFSIKQVWFELDDFERQTYSINRTPASIMQKIKVGDANMLLSNEYPPASAGGGSPFMNGFAKGILGFLDGIRLKLKDSRYNFLFEPGDYTPNIDGSISKDIDDLLFNWVGSEIPITILDLSGIPSDMMTSISGTLLKIIYDALFWGQELAVGGKEQPLLIVLEEAHNYLKAGEKSIASRTVQSIAKEGRKYGVGLALVTQRPSELDETVLSQCGTIIALRMNNSKDRAHIRGAMQDELQVMVDLLPSLRTGEGIISGEGVRIPSRIQFYKLANAIKSSDPKVSEKWMKKKARSINSYQKLLSHWRNQKLGGESNE